MAAQNSGLSSILILTGVTNEETADASDIKPTWRVRNYEELSKLVFSG
jgi:ribonucleotide monophosphatase NagD (HAD superfamily)